MDAPGRPTRRLAELDSLRGIAALSVVLYHFTIMYGRFFAEADPPALTFGRGYLGVYLFFIISGFVILMTITKTRSLLDFIVSRVSRIYPAYWVAVILTFVVLSISGLWPEGEIAPLTAIFNLSMLQRFAHIHDVDGVYWTLQYELVFYAIAAAVLFFGLIRRIEWICATLLLVSMAYAAALDVDLFARLGPLGFALKWVLILVVIFQNVQFFVIGMTLYRIWTDGFTKVRGGLLALALITTLVVSGAYLALVAAAFSLIIALAVTGRLTWLQWRPLAFLGTISYTLYLTHQNIGYVLIHFLERRGVDANVAIPLAVLTMIGIGTVITFTVEKPAMRLLRTWYRQLRIRHQAMPSQPVASPAD